MQDPVVSVVMPCFNQGEFLAEAIESVLMQTFPLIEIIVVEDYSTDGFTRDLVRNCVFPRTRTILHDTNQGVVATRNTAVRAARGPYILPLDADDMIAPTFVERALEKLQDGTADVCYSRVMLCGTEEREFTLPPFSLEKMLQRNLVVNTAMYRKSAWAEVGGYSEAMSTGLEDWDFWLSLLENGNRFHRIDEPLFFYRRHGTSRTDSAQKNEEHLMATLFARHKTLFRRYGMTITKPWPSMLRKKRARRLRKSVRRLASSVFRRDVAPVNPVKRPILLHYFKPPGIANFGDQLNVTLLGALTGRPVRERGVTDATHLCIGSLLEGFLRRRGATTSIGTPLQVWGAGFIAAPGEHPALGIDAFQADGKEEFLRPVVVHAVRGRLTLERLRAMGLPVEGVALGDPGLLARLLVPPRPDGTRPARGLRLGIVPHYVDAEEPILSELLCRFPLARLVRVSEPPLEFLKQLSACDIVLSSAMQGLIAADSLGIPNAWMRLSDRLTGGDWKFRDYYSVFGVEPAVLAIDDLDRLRDDDLRNLAAAHPVTEAHVQEAVWNLLSTCPFLLPQADAERRALQPDIAASLRGLWYAKVASRFGT
jgi:glycosyltransferase involved in cell wall biosynthesis